MACEARAHRFRHWASGVPWPRSCEAPRERWAAGVSRAGSAGPGSQAEAWSFILGARRTRLRFKDYEIRSWLQNSQSRFVGHTASEGKKEAGVCGCRNHSYRELIMPQPCGQRRKGELEVLGSPGEAAVSNAKQTTTTKPDNTTTSAISPRLAYSFERWKPRSLWLRKVGEFLLSARQWRTLDSVQSTSGM